MIFQVILLVLLLACSAFLSGSETAFFALSRHELRQFQQRRGAGRLVAELMRRGGGIGAAALCGGGGQGDALIVRVD